jgi:hypothetical protein
MDFGFRRFILTNATVAPKLGNRAVLNSAKTEFLNLKMERRWLLTRSSAGAVAARFIVQHVRLFATKRQLFFHQEIFLTVKRRERTKVCFGKPPAKYAGNNTGQIITGAFVLTANRKSLKPLTGVKTYI